MNRIYRKTNPFYLTKEWRHKRRIVIEADKKECQYCKARGYYSKAVSVHHVKPIEQFPELALEDYYIDAYGNRQRQLVSACDKCHKEQDRKHREEKEQLNEERW